MKLFTVMIFSILAGCSAFNTLGDYINENPLFASIAARQAVSRYIAAGDTIEAEKARAEAVQKRLTKINRYIDGNPSTTASGLLSMIDNSIDWQSLEPADRILVDDILLLVKLELDKFEQNEAGLTESSKIAIKALFDVAISAAKLYAGR